MIVARVIITIINIKLIYKAQDCLGATNVLGHVIAVCYYKPAETGELMRKFKTVREGFWVLLLKWVSNSRCRMTESTSGGVGFRGRLSQQSNVFMQYLCVCWHLLNTCYSFNPIESTTADCA